MLPGLLEAGVLLLIQSRVAPGVGVFKSVAE